MDRCASRFCARPVPGGRDSDYCDDRCATDQAEYDRGAQLGKYVTFAEHYVGAVRSRGHRAAATRLGLSLDRCGHFANVEAMTYTLADNRPGVVEQPAFVEYVTDRGGDRELAFRILLTACTDWTQADAIAWRDTRIRPRWVYDAIAAHGLTPTAEAD